MADVTNHYKLDGLKTSKPEKPLLHSQEEDKWAIFSLLELQAMSWDLGRTTILFGQNK